MQDIRTMLEELERELGALSTVQKILLGTDGSVTALLEIVTGGPVEIETLLQEVGPCDAALAESLGIAEGDPVNHRIVELKNGRTGEVLIYARSETPLRRLDPAFRADLMRADIPIGKIMQRHRIEARREITGFGIRPADEQLSSVFSIFRNEPLITRSYHIVHQEKPLIAIEEVFPYSRFGDTITVAVDAPSRLHLALTDMHGGLGRVDGGVGITLDSPRTVLLARRSGTLAVRGGGEEQQARVREAAGAVCRHFGLPPSGEFTLIDPVPQHRGLGSGTQIALSTAAAVCQLAGRSLGVREMARIVGRGGTSGIGTAAFETGGLIVDGGHSFGEFGEKKEFRPSAASRGTTPAHPIARHPFPEDWSILLVTPRTGEGASRREEVDIFRSCCPVPLDEVREICHEVLVRMLPGVVEHDLDLFGAAVNRIQQIGFKKVEIGRQAPLVGTLMDALREGGAACAGMSSFGPTVYAVADTGVPALEKAAREVLGEEGGDIRVTKARNTGAFIRTAQGT
ncbi:MAG: beta-ribofuranosylaminobenzene 5'-phosphate synthase [Methanomicrobiales archaeon]|nr:beta-ribofuranosylaminobenzene 5'-phosphate synthase [Methanomicrobiales archaeon]MDI6875852.1 beta-ribofuranosylaminobenzene 5'-phosphate synthase [Methanomicrobiales archaeon]